MSLHVEGTILTITGMGIAPYSARGLSQRLALVTDTGNLTRSINGRAQNWNMAQFQKYATTITCTDQMVPALDGIWPGDEFTMECACNLSYPVGGTAQRPAVTGSEFTDNGFVFYRPVLEVQFVNFEYTFDEWGASLGWTADFVEV
jgi:hypothetical protein